MVKKLETLADRIEAAARLRADIAALAAQAAPLKADLEALETEIQVSLVASGTEAVKTPVGTYSLKRTIVPMITDMDAFIKYAKKNPDVLLAPKIAVPAWRARADANEDVPGVEVETVTSLAFRKATK